MFGPSTRIQPDGWSLGRARSLRDAGAGGVGEGPFSLGGREWRMLVRSVSGVRGIVGDGLSPVLVRRFAEAFAERGGTVAVAQDGRSSGLWLAQAALQGLKSGGASPVYVGLCATPAAQIAVEELAAAGGIVITASHNPDGWNGLKFVGPDGTFLAPAEMEA